MGSDRERNNCTKGKRRRENRDWKVWVRRFDEGSQRQRKKGLLRLRVVQPSKTWGTHEPLCKTYLDEESSFSSSPFTTLISLRVASKTSNFVFIAVEQTEGSAEFRQRKALQQRWKWWRRCGQLGIRSLLLVVNILCPNSLICVVYYSKVLRERRVAIDKTYLHHHAALPRVSSTDVLS